MEVTLITVYVCGCTVRCSSDVARRPPRAEKAKAKRVKRFYRNERVTTSLNVVMKPRRAARGVCISLPRALSFILRALPYSIVSNFPW